MSVTCVVVVSLLALSVDVGSVDVQPERGAQLVQHLRVGQPEAGHEAGALLSHIVTQDHASVWKKILVKQM